MKLNKSPQPNPINHPPPRRICTSWIVPLLLLWMLPLLGAQAAVAFTSLYSFTGGNDGAHPNGLVRGTDGYFYGTTAGGAYTSLNWYGTGTVFQVSTNGSLTTLYDFGSITNASGVALDGANPAAALVQGSDGYFYGTTSQGGTNGVEYDAYGRSLQYGTVFRISTNGALTTLYDFGSITNASGVALDGANPTAALVQGSDGSFYGTTQNGGTNGVWPGEGTVFKIGTNGALTSLHFFSENDYGYNPTAALVQGSDGSFYGTTQNGGTNGWGTVFKISTNRALTTLYAFGMVTDTNGLPLDGGNPQAGLVQGTDGYFYGTTYFGGTNGEGTVFRISTNGALITLYSFIGVGFNVSGLVQGSDGSFYGMNVQTPWSPVAGPAVAVGTVFKISTNGVFTGLYSLSTGNAYGCGLVQGTDGSFYGWTANGGTNGFNDGIAGFIGYGTLFRLTIVPDPQLTIIPSGPYMILTWPTNATGYTLQSATNLAPAAVWTTNSSPPVVIGGQNVVINTISGRQQFYRLSSP
jgi:uncharacterized repeat protein (TIGR03803 family)